MKISILDIGLLNKFFKDAILLTFILLNLLFSSVLFLLIVKIKEFPSFKMSRFNSKRSEKINSSKTEDKSVSLIIP